MRSAFIHCSFIHPTNTPCTSTVSKVLSQDWQALISQDPVLDSRLTQYFLGAFAFNSSLCLENSPPYNFKAYFLTIFSTIMPLVTTCLNTLNKARLSKNSVFPYSALHFLHTRITDHKFCNRQGPPIPNSISRIWNSVSVSICYTGERRKKKKGRKRTGRQVEQKEKGEENFNQ